MLTATKNYAKKLATGILLLFIGSSGLTVGLGVFFELLYSFHHDGIHDLIKAIIPGFLIVVSLVAIVIGGSCIRDIIKQVNSIRLV